MRSLDFEPWNITAFTEEKDMTVRYQEGGDLDPGDIVALTDTDGNRFAFAEVTNVMLMTPTEFVQADFDGHKKYDSGQEFAEKMNTYYPEADITTDTKLRVIFFGEIHFLR